MLDEYIWGEVRRISPEAPVPVVEVRRRSFVPGGAANTAANVAALGGRPVLVSVVGPDHAAATLRDELARAAPTPDGLCVDAARCTTTKSRIVAHNQQVAAPRRRGARSPLPAALEDALLAAVGRHLPRVEACIISDYAKGVVTPRVARELIRLARQAGRPVVVDPKGADYTKYRGATLVKPNLHEAERSAKVEITGEATLREAAGRLIELLEGSAAAGDARRRRHVAVPAGEPPLARTGGGAPGVRRDRGRRHGGRHAGDGPGGAAAPWSRPSTSPTGRRASWSARSARRR